MATAARQVRTVASEGGRDGARCGGIAVFGYAAFAADARIASWERAVGYRSHPDAVRAVVLGGPRRLRDHRLIVRSGFSIDSGRRSESGIVAAGRKMPMPSGCGASSSSTASV